MKRLILPLLILLSFAATAQIYQPITGYGFRWQRVMPDSVLHVPKSTDTAFRTNSRAPQLRIVGDSLWIYDGAKWKRAGAGGGSTVTTLPWDSITGKPVNFSTTYALSNDIADSIQARVIVKDNADYRLVLGSSNVKELKAQSRLNFYPDSGIMVVGAAPGSGYGAEVGFDNVTTNGTYWGLYGGSTSVNGLVLYRYQPSQIELAYWDADRYALRSDVKMAWSSTLLAFGTPDVAISREGASLLQINNGTTNSYADLKLRTLTSTTLSGTGSRMVVADANGTLSTTAIPTGSVVSVFGRSGTVTAQSGDYTTAQVTESGNLYFTDARARGAISVSGSLSYNSTTGVISYTQPTNVSTFTNDAGYITSASLSGYAQLSGATFTGNIAVYNGQNGEIRLGNNSAYRGVIYYDGDINGQFYFDNTYNSNSTSGGFLFRTKVSGTAVNALTIAGSGDAIFINNVTASQFNGSGAGLTGTASSLSIGGNAATVTNGVYTSGSYSNPSWITSLAWGKITGAPSFITGNQTITLSGDATGSGATSIAVTLANSGVSAGTYTKVTVDAKGRVTSGTTLASADLPTYTGTLTSSQITTGLGYTPYNSSNPSGYITNAALSSYLPLSGGTLTGTLTMGNTTTGQNINLYSSSYGSNGILSGYGTDGGVKFQAGALGNTQAFVFANTGVDLSLFAGGLERVTIKSSGSVGIGTTNPGADFEISRAGALTQRITNSANGTQLEFGTTGGAGFFGTKSESSLIITTFDIERLRVTSAGRILFGTSTDNGIDLVQVNGNGLLTGTLKIFAGQNGEILIGNNASYRGRIYYDGDANGQLVFSNSYNATASSAGFLFRTRTSGTAVNALTIGGDGATTFVSSVTATSFFESSDLRLKNVLSRIKSSDNIDAIFYSYKSDKSKRWGYVAQEVEKVLPYAVTTGDDGFKKVDYTTVHTYKIAQLEARIAQLEKLLHK